MIKKLLLASVLFTLSTSGAFAFQAEYFVSGVNLTTGERVIGWLAGTLNEAEVQGHILDRGDHYAVIGTFSGKGLFSLRSLCCEYEVEVTNEVTEDKIENRRTYQKEWK